MWRLEHKVNTNNQRPCVFETRELAQSRLDNMGESIASYYRIVYDSGDAYTDKFLTEGLVKGDLEGIILPRVSVDEYVPADSETDNIVIAFYIKGEPKATIPVKNFAEHSKGVLSTDYGDSETVVNTQIVYVEFDRENLENEDIHTLVTQVAMLANLEADDFTMTFPHTNKKFPYDIGLMQRYFKSRTERKNREAQRRAEKDRQKKIHKELKRLHQQDQKEQPKPEEASPEESPGEGMTPAEAMGAMPKRR